MESLTFVERLKRVIAATPGLTEAGLATKAGLDNSTIRGMIRENRNPRLDTAEKICRALGTTYTTFMAMDQRQDEDQYAEIRKLWLRLSPEQRLLLLGYGEGLSQREGPGTSTGDQED